MSTALALIQTTEFDLMSRLAEIAAGSTYTKQNKTQAMFIMLKGYELGISPMQALDGIQVIQGKTTVSPQLMLALINRSGLLEDIKIDGDAKSCSVTMKRVGRSPHTETFNMENAKAMGLADKDNYRKQPAVMLKWRAVSACARIVFSDVIGGMYTPEEMGAEVSEDASGEIVIEAPLAIVDDKFKQSEDAVNALLDKNPPPNVDSDGVIEGEMVSESNEAVPNSSAAQKSVSTITVKDFVALKTKPAVYYENTVVRHVIHDYETGKYHIYFGNAYDAKNGHQFMNEDTLLGLASNSADAAKSKLAGNGAPAPGEKKVIGKDAKKAAPSWKTEIGKVKNAVLSLYDHPKHMEASIAKMEKEGKLTDDMNTELAIRVITNHKNEAEAPF